MLVCAHVCKCACVFVVRVCYCVCARVYSCVVLVLVSVFEFVCLRGACVFVCRKPASHCPTDRRIGGSGGKSDEKIGQWENLRPGG